MGRNILVLSPHPDDESIGCGGAICKHVVEGDRVHVVFLTSGEAGGHGLPPDRVMTIREAEAREAATILEIEPPQFWRQPDGKLEPTQELIDRLGAQVQSLEPFAVYVPHSAEMHPDHRAAARLVADTVKSYPQLGQILVRMYEIWTPIQTLNEIVDISEHMERKLTAVRAYTSQCEVLRFDEAIQGLNRYRGEMHSWPGGDYAEVFQRMRF